MGQSTSGVNVNHLPLPSVDVLKSSEVACLFVPRDWTRSLAFHYSIGRYTVRDRRRAPGSVCLLGFTIVRTTAGAIPKPSVGKKIQLSFFSNSARWRSHERMQNRGDLRGEEIIARTVARGGQNPSHGSKFTSKILRSISSQRILGFWVEQNQERLWWTESMLQNASVDSEFRH